VRFESNVVIRGKIVITNKGKTQGVIKEGTVVEKDIVFK
jgi:hypothetical protein